MVDNESNSNSNSSPVRDFFRGKDLFITGATGFLGMALIEKLLRVCPDVGTIYVLVRPKKGKEVSARIEELTKNPVCSKRYILTFLPLYHQLLLLNKLRNKIKYYFLFPPKCCTYFFFSPEEPDAWYKV
jgi:hypothetical protein